MGPTVSGWGGGNPHALFFSQIAPLHFIYLYAENSQIKVKKLLHTVGFEPTTDHDSPRIEATRPTAPLRLTEKIIFI